MKGRRLYHMDAGLFTKSGGQLIPVRHESGDYWKDTKGRWYFHCPRGVIDISKYNIVEHDDGTITVMPQIRANGKVKWVGSLSRGKWSYG